MQICQSNFPELSLTPIKIKRSDKHYSDVEEKLPFFKSKISSPSTIDSSMFTPSK